MSETPEFDADTPTDMLHDPVGAVLDDLYTAANDAEAAVLHDLTRRTGYVWECGDQACQGGNPGHVLTCRHCGTHRPAMETPATLANTHAGHGHIQNQAVAWNRGGDQVALFVPPHGSAFVVFAYADGRPQLCQLIPRQARELFENAVTSWESSGQLDGLYGK